MKQTPDPRDPSRELMGEPDVGRWRGRTALAFVLLTLAALVLVPLLVQQRVNQVRVTIETAEPARTLINRFQFSLVREMSSLNELLLTGQVQYARTWEQARSEEDTILVALRGLVAELGPEVQARFDTVRTLTAAWHARWAAAEEAARAGRFRPDSMPPRERNLFEATLRKSAALDSAVVVAVGEGRAAIFAAEQAGIRATLVLGLLAFLAAVVVARLNGRVRRYADQSERRRLQAERALAETARAEEARRRLLRGVTHDVKNPLGAAKGYAELLAMGVKAPVHPDQVPLLEGVERSIDTALTIIADLLDVARADSGQLSVHRVHTDLDALVTGIVEDHRALAETAGHTLTCECGEEIDLHTDPARVRQVLGNLLSNAIKYTPPPGQISVRGEIVSDAGGPRPGSWARISVSDTGPGIPAEQREGIFNEFTRLDDGSKLKGHGLGLAIARRVARLLGGDLTLAEPSDGGATFILWLPFRKDDEVVEQGVQVAQDVA